MPIANCTVQADCVAGKRDLVAMWSREAGVSPEHMTVNLVRADQQFGKAYKVMTSLYLPSLWSGEKAESLAVGLASALAEYFSLPLGDIHVITSVVESGYVVENGKVERW